VVEETLREFDLWPLRSKRFMELSGGQAKRLEVAKLFVHRPAVAIFDEPTAMIDLEGKRMVWDKIKMMRDKGTTIMVATNEVREAEYLADRIGIMKAGKEVVTENLRVLKDSISGGDIVEVVFSTAVSRELLNAIKSMQGTVRVAEESEEALKVYVNRSEDWLPQMMASVQLLQAKIISVRVTEPSLDDVFLHYTEDQVAT